MNNVFKTLSIDFVTFILGFQQESGMVEKVGGAKLAKFRKIFSAAPSAPRKMAFSELRAEIMRGRIPFIPPIGRFWGAWPPSSPLVQDPFSQLLLYL